MKISYKAFPALSCLETGKMDLSHLRLPADVLPAMEALWSQRSTAFSSQIFLLTENFVGPLQQRILAFSEDQELSGAGNLSCAFLWKGWTKCIFTDDVRQEYFYFEFAEKYLTSFVYQGPDPVLNHFAFHVGARGDWKVGVRMAIDAFAQCIATHYFMENCPIEEVTVQARQKVSSALVPDKKLKNETGLKVTYVNALWDKDLYVGGPIFVPGHSRRQRYGPRFSLVKKIWIESFCKAGYHRRAQQTLTFGGE